VELALKIAASAYLLFLAYRLARGFSVGQASVPEPFTVGRATAFQFINPKGWFFAFALVGAFAGSDGITIAEGFVTIGIVAIIVAATATGWAAGGSALSRRLHADRTRRIVGLALGVALAGSVAFLWI
jgi:threonine/homoserine/homoserine lactone efflux protein